MDGWLSNKRDTFQINYYKEALQTSLTYWPYANKAKAKEKALEESNRKANETIHLLKAKITATSDRLNTSFNNVNNYSEKINNLNKELVNTTNPQDIGTIKSNLKTYEELYKKAVKQENLDIKEIQSLSNTNDPNIVKSDFSDLFNNFIDSYKEFLNTLTSEQMVIVFNLSGYTMLLSTLNSITIILLGDQIINWLKLDIKYPKLAKLIKFKQILNKHSLRFNIVLFYILILSLTSINLYMFLYDYLLQL